MSDFSKSLENQREDYAKQELHKADVRENPFEQFSAWFEQATKSDTREPYAMALATATKEAIPSVRMVLLRQFDAEGFIFYTNYNSRKGKDLAENPKASLLFFWEGLEQQVRIDGKVEKVSPEVSEKYFSKRPFKSQVAAVASSQSEVLSSRKVLDDKFKALLALQEDAGSIERPEHWGGYLIVPNHFEFWQGRRSRLHDRMAYTLKNGKWALERLAP